MEVLMQRKHMLGFIIPGALGASKIVYFAAPSNSTLIHVSCYCVTQDATIKIGTKSPTDNDDAYLVSATVTASTQTEYERTDFVGDQYPRISDGDLVCFTVGHGSGCVDFTIVFTFAEG